jgi:type II secretory pathway pseudopilin PulG
MIRSRDTGGGRRAGVAVLWALIVLGVLALTSAAAAWQFVAARRVLERRQHKVQALWLARSGGELAAARLLADPTGYAGEEVEPVPEGRVKITVQKDAAKPEAYRVRCEAQYPATGPGSIGATLTWTATRRTAPDGVRLELVEPGDGGVP